MSIGPPGELARASPVGIFSCWIKREKNQCCLEPSSAPVSGRFSPGLTRRSRRTSARRAAAAAGGGFTLRMMRASPVASASAGERASRGSASAAVRRAAGGGRRRPRRAISAHGFPPPDAFRWFRRFPAVAARRRRLKVRPVVSGFGPGGASRSKSLAPAGRRRWTLGSLLARASAAASPTLSESYPQMSNRVQF